MISIRTTPTTNNSFACGAALQALRLYQPINRLTVDSAFLHKIVAVLAAPELNRPQRWLQKK